MGRYLDLVGEPDNPLQGLSLDYSLAPALATATMPVAAVSSPADYTMWAYGLGEPVDGTGARDLRRAGSSRRRPRPPTRRRATPPTTPASCSTRWPPSSNPRRRRATTSPVTYPQGEFAERLAVLAAMLHTGMPIKCASLNAVGSYDTHSDETDTLSTNLEDTVSALVAFQRDLEARGLDQRVLIQLWSEFGRRPRENGSGTDHGAGGVALLIGTRAAGKMVGEFPGLTKLDGNENVVKTSDFRAMYCSLLEQWFQTEAGLVIPEASSFERPVLVA